MSKLKEFIDKYDFGSTLCDMHYGLSQLETGIPGFQLLSHHNIRCDGSTDAVVRIIAGVTDDPRPYHNKMLVLVGEVGHSVFYAVYSYDNRYFGSVCFKIAE